MRKNNLRFIILANSLLVAGMIVSACSAESNDNPITQAYEPIPAAGNNGNNTNDGPIAGSTSSTPLYTPGAPVGPAPINESTAAADFEEEDVCAGTAVDPKPVEIEIEIQVPFEVEVPSPISIYLMLDRSMSMNEGVPTKWEIAKTALDQFVNDPKSEFINVALQYFTLPDPACDGAAYQTPAVPMGPLPGNAGAISSSLAGTQLNSMTAIEPALRGMTAFCAQYQQQNPEQECVGVFVSDGAPTQCSGDPNTLVGIARNAYDNPPHIKTFTVGMMGASFQLLNDIAMWGGTDCTPENTTDGYACDVSSGMSLLEALEAIRKYVTKLELKTEYRTEYQQKISECDWGIPPMPADTDQVFNPDKVNVVFSEPNKTDVFIGKVESVSACTDKGGWYYDNPAAPTMIKSCEQTCEYIKSVPGAMINIEFGCDSVIVLN